MIKDFFNKHNIEYKENISLKNYNTLKIDASCNFLVFPKSIEELKEVLQFIKKNKIKYIVLGNGSNIILANEHYDDIIIKLDKLNKITYSENEVTVGAGYSLIKLSTELIAKGYSGLEFACGIPGSIGASVAMNAGAYKSDMAAIVKNILVLKKDNEIVELSNKDLQYKYRDSIIKNNKDYIVLSATLNLIKGNTEEMKKLVEERRTKRVSTQPLNFPSAGSVFRNPENMFAGELIEKANLKGLNINGAEVSTKHANFIINKGNATGKDIIKLINIIKKEIKEKNNIDLQLEQIIIE